ncbi:MAG: 1-acyl-sn-glycerol-3-phosphate acyltransferase [Candidatus Obscuribacterales bacterium]
MVDFKASKPPGAFSSVVHSLVPLYFAVFHRDMQIRVTRKTLSLFRSLQKDNVIICPNHSHHEDAEIIYWLSCITQQHFSILTAREMFERYGHVAGPILQRLGCYSVLRGVRDSDAVRFTEHLLEHGPTKLVIFPEGEISFDSSKINPLQEGAVRMGLESCQHLLQHHKPADIYVLPLAISYKYSSEIDSACRKSLRQLEQKLALPEDENRDLRQQAFAVAQELVASKERHWQVRTTGTFDSRVKGLVKACIQNCAERLKRKTSHQANPISQLHSLQAAVLELKVSANRDSLSASELSEIERSLADTIVLSSLRADRFAQTADAESFVEALAVLEEILLGKPTAKGPRRILIKAAEPVNLLDYIQDFHHNRTATVDAVTNLLTARLRRSLAVDASYHP